MATSIVQYAKTADIDSAVVTEGLRLSKVSYKSSTNKKTGKVNVPQFANAYTLLPERSDEDIAIVAMEILPAVRKLVESTEDAMFQRQYELAGGKLEELPTITLEALIEFANDNAGGERILLADIQQYWNEQLSIRYGEALADKIGEPITHQRVLNGLEVMKMHFASVRSTNTVLFTATCDSMLRTLALVPSEIAAQYPVSRKLAARVEYLKNQSIKDADTL